MPTAGKQRRLILSAYHEAGHAVVWHAVNGLVEEVSIASDRRGYHGYCRFGFLVDDECDPHASSDAWAHHGRIHPKTVTAYYAGMLAVAFYCAWHEGENEDDDSLEGSERDDLEKIQALLLRLGSDEQQRAGLKEACWLNAQKLLSDSWPAVQAVATTLLKRRTLDGRAVHRIIWQTMGYPNADWRLQALNLTRTRVSSASGKSTR